MIEFLRKYRNVLSIASWRTNGFLQEQKVKFFLQVLAQMIIYVSRSTPVLQYIQAHILNDCKNRLLNRVRHTFV